MNSFKHDHNNRPIACPDCEGKSPTMFQAHASDEILMKYDVDHIDDMDDIDIRRESRPYNLDCWIEGHCLPCNGPDDGDCGDGEDFHE